MSASAEEARLRSALRLGVTGVLSGIALTLTASTDVGGVVTVLSVAWVVWSLHRFGRLGPDPS